MQAHRLCGCFINEFALMYGASSLPCPDDVEHLSLEQEFIWPFINEECSFNEVFEPNVKDHLLIHVVRESKDEFMWIISFEREIISNYLLVTTSLPADQGHGPLAFRHAVTEMPLYDGWAIKEGICMQDMSIERKPYLNVSSERSDIKSILNYSEDVWDFCWLAGGILGDVYWISPATSALFTNSLL